MRRTSFLVVLGAVASSTVVTAPGVAGAVGPTYRQERVYFHCADENVRLHNVAGVPDDAPVAWDTRPPAAAFVDSGAGCATADPNVATTRVSAAGQRGDVPVDAVFEGTFTGNLDDLTVNLHDLSQRPGTPVGGGVEDLEVSLLVDGEEVLDGVAVAPTARAENSGVTYAVDFSIADLGIGTEEGNGTITRTLHLVVASGNGNVWAYDATEVAAGITFNPPTLAAATVRP